MANNGGFGLNYNRGFGSGPVFVGGGISPGQYDASQGYQQRLTQQQQNDFQNQQRQQQNQFDQQSQLRQMAFGQQQLATEAALRQQGYGVQERIAQGGYDSQRQIAQVQADASKYPAQLQQERFNQVFPYLSQQLAGAGSYAGGGGGGGSARGGGGGGGPGGQVYNPDQIQQQVNAQRATNDQATAGRTRSMQQQMAARGYGANSPLAQELGIGLANQNLQSNTDVERQTRFDAAKANADQAMKSAQLGETSYANRQQEDIARQQIYQSKYNALLAALSGLV